MKILKFVSYYFIVLTIGFSSIHAQDVENYCINFMWINKTKNDNIYLYKNPEDSSLDKEEYFKDEVVKPIQDWAKKNPSASVYFWYDSKYSQTDAINTSEKLIVENFKNISLRDIRELERVKEEENTVVFENSTPVYLRSDLLRPIIQIHMIQKENFKYCVCSDLDVYALGQEELFDDLTKNNLKETGIVMASGKGTISYTGYENLFSILSNNRPSIITALEQMVIKSSIKRATLYSGVRDSYTIQRLLPQVVFYFYQYLLQYANFLEGKLIFKNPVTSKLFDPVQDEEHFLILFPWIEHPKEQSLAYSTLAYSGKNKLFMVEVYNLLEKEDRLVNCDIPVKKIKAKEQGGSYCDYAASTVKCNSGTMIYPSKEDVKWCSML